MGRTGVVAALLDDAARTVRQVDTMTKAPAKRHNCEIRVANKNKHGNFTRTQDACGQRKANTRHSPHARAWTCAQHMSERGDNFHDDRMTHQPEDESAAPGGRAACGQALYGTWLCYVCVDEIPSDSAGASSQTAEELRTLRLHVSRKQTRATGVGCSCIGRARHRAHAVTRPSPGTSVQAGSKMAILTDGHVEKCLYCIRCLSTLESVRTTYTYSLGGGDDARHLTHATHAQGGHHHPDRTCDAFVGLKKPEKSSCTNSLARLNCTALWLPPPLVAATANKNRTFPQKAACCVEMDSNSRATSARPRMGLLMGAGSARSRDRVRLARASAPRMPLEFDAPQASAMGHTVCMHTGNFQPSPK